MSTHLSKVSSICPVDTLELRVMNACKSTILNHFLPWHAIICLPLIAEFRGPNTESIWGLWWTTVEHWENAFVWDIQVILIPTDDIFHVCLSPWVIYYHNRPVLNASYNFLHVVYCRLTSVGLLQEEEFYVQSLHQTYFTGYNYLWRRRIFWR